MFGSSLANGAVSLGGGGALAAGVPEAAGTTGLDARDAAADALAAAEAASGTAALAADATVALAAADALAAGAATATPERSSEATRGRRVRAIASVV